MQLPGQGPGGATFRVAGVVEKDALVPLGPGQRYVPAVDDHHMVPAVAWRTADTTGESQPALPPCGSQGK